jgi:tetratricopeptide (TPR) repeat protein
VFGVVDDFKENPILRCLVAFGDILVNPACAGDYDEAPAQPHDVVPVLAFARETMANIISIYDDFSGELANLYADQWEAFRKDRAAPFDLIQAISYAMTFTTDEGYVDCLLRALDRAHGPEREVLNDLIYHSGVGAREYAEKTIADLRAARGRTGVQDLPDLTPAAAPFDLIQAIEHAMTFTTDEGYVDYLLRAHARARAQERVVLDDLIYHSGPGAREYAEKRIADLRAARSRMGEPDARDSAPAAPVGAGRPENVVSALKPLADRLLLHQKAQDAIDVYKKRTEAQPENIGAWCDLGCAHMEIGRYIRAADAFKRALLIADNDRRALSNLALAQYEMLDYEAAAETLERYLELDSDEAALSLWRQCKKQLRMQEERDQVLLAKDPDAPLPQRGLPCAADIDLAIQILRDAGEDVDNMNDCEILLLYESRYRPEAREA